MTTTIEFKPFYPLQKVENREKYKQLLSGFTQTSPMYSDNLKPYLPYRVAEKIFCVSFLSKDVSRKDASVDAVKEKDGIGIKTFVSNGVRKYEKIAEFDNRTKYPLDRGNIPKLIGQVAHYRNDRLGSTVKMYQLKNCLYHYLVRDIRKILISECPMRPIDMKSIEVVSEPSQRKSIKFKDKFNSYSFSLSKSTLFQAFTTNKPIEVVKISYEIDKELLLATITELTRQKKEEVSLLESKEHVILPLYSTRIGKVPEKSGLNQWNAGGRKRDYDEVYIPIPIQVHKKNPGFFPPRDKKFILKTEEGKEFSVKLCQDNSKALMSDPNKDLGKWLLRDMLGLKEGELATAEYLAKKEADTVIIYKLKEGLYQIGLHSFGGFEKGYGENA